MKKLKRNDYQLSARCICPAGVSQHNERAVSAAARFLFGARLTAAVLSLVLIHRAVSWIASLDWSMILHSVATVVIILIGVVLSFFQAVKWIGDYARREFNPLPVRAVRFIAGASKRLIHRFRVRLYFRQIERNADRYPEVKTASVAQLAALSGHHDDPVVSPEALEAYREALSRYQASIQPAAPDQRDRVSQRPRSPQNQPATERVHHKFEPINLN